MKSFRRLAAAVVVVISGATAHADSDVRTGEADPEAAPSPSDVVPVVAAAYPDYPPYPPGFSSYRGLGFVGFCCTPPARCAAEAWAGYCDQGACAGQVLTLGAPSPAWLGRPAWSCRPAACGQSAKAPCGSDWPARPSSCFGRRLWLRGYPTGIPGDCGGGCESGNDESDLAAPDQAETGVPLPEPPAAGTPSPESASETVPSLPAPSASDRSAWRSDLRRLPSVEGSY